MCSSGLQRNVQCRITAKCTVQDYSEMCSAGLQQNVKCRITAKCAVQDYKPMMIFYQNLQLTQLIRHFRIREINGCEMSGECAETDRQTDRLPRFNLTFA